MPNTDRYWKSLPVLCSRPPDSGVNFHRQCSHGNPGKRFGHGPKCGILRHLSTMTGKIQHSQTQVSSGTTVWSLYFSIWQFVTLLKSTTTREETVSQLAKLTISLFLSFRAWPGIHCFIKVLRYWMPDQVRHDKHKLNTFLNYDTVSKRMAWILELKPKKQKHASAKISVLATGCKTPGLYSKKLTSWDRSDPMR